MLFSHMRLQFEAAIHGVNDKDGYYRLIEVFGRQYLHKHWKILLAAIQRSEKFNTKGELQKMCTAKGALFTTAQILGVNVEFTPPLL